MGFDGSEMRKNRQAASSLPPIKKIEKITKPITDKSLPLAIGLNFVLPGLGYGYMGKWIVGSLACLLIIGIYATNGLLLIIPTWFGLNIIMLIDMLILANKRKKMVIESTMRKCPNCAEIIQNEARACRFCNTKIEII